MTRLGLLLNAIGATLLLAALAAAVVAERSPKWRQHQRDYLAQAATDDGIRPHEIVIPALAIVDRCTSCHLGMEPGSAAFATPHTAHPGHFLDTHPIASFACTSCHGGQGRSLAGDRAHDRRPGGGWSAFTDPTVRCARCHPATISGSDTTLAHGLDLFIAEACVGCHQPGRTGPGLGPNLAAIGLRGSDYIRQVVLYPDRVYPDTIMPPLRFRIAADDPRITDLVTFLSSLEPWPRDQPRVERRFDPRSCASCHRIDRPELVAAGIPHRCDYLKREGAMLACKNCHKPQPPARADDAATAGAEPGAAESGPNLDPSATCPQLSRAFSACGLCHREGER